MQEPPRDAYTQNLPSFGELYDTVAQSREYKEESTKELQIIRTFEHSFIQYFNVRNAEDKAKLKNHYVEILHKSMVEYFVAYLQARKLLNFDYREGFKHVGDYAEKFIGYIFQKFYL
jgi:hypothetical protein